MGRSGEVAGAANLVLVSGAAMLRPDVQMFEAMLKGWRHQQLSRNLAPATIAAGTSIVSRFQVHSAEFPWRWTPAHLEDWTADLRSVRRRRGGFDGAERIRRAMRIFLRVRLRPGRTAGTGSARTGSGRIPVQICHDW